MLEYQHTRQLPIVPSGGSSPAWRSRRHRAHLCCFRLVSDGQSQTSARGSAYVKFCFFFINFFVLSLLFPHHARSVRDLCRLLPPPPLAGFTTARAEGSAADGYANLVYFDGVLVGAQRNLSGLGPGELRSHVFTVNLGTPDHIPHRLEVWQDAYDQVQGLGEAAPGPTDWIYAHPRRREIRVTFGGFGSDLVAGSSGLVLWGEGRRRTVPWDQLVCLAPEDTIPTVHLRFVRVRMEFQEHNRGPQVRTSQKSWSRANVQNRARRYAGSRMYDVSASMWLSCGQSRFLVITS